MASSLAAQLSQIAAKSTHQLDLKAQKAAHSQSLIFEKTVAGSQTFDTIYQIAYEGFLEICALDSRFTKFQRTIFSEQSKTEDRLQMNKAQIEELDRVLEEFLALVGSRLLLSPAVKAVDWLIRRFRVHEYNTSFVLMTFLPYHTTPLFLNLLSIIPEKNLAPVFKVLDPYRRSLINPPRHPLIHSATTNRHFFAALNNYVLKVTKSQYAYAGLLSFWAGIITEAVAGMLDAARSGRTEVERRNKEDILLRVLPILHDGLALTSTPDMIVGCYMLCIVIATKGNLDDKVLDGLTEAISGSLSPETFSSGFTSLSILVQHKEERTLPANVIKALSRAENLLQLLSDAKQRRSTDALVHALIDATVHDLWKTDGPSRLALVDSILQKDILTRDGLVEAMAIVAKGADDSLKTGNLNEDSRGSFSDLIHKLSETDKHSHAFRDAIAKSQLDLENLEIGFQTTLKALPAPREAQEDVEMEDATEIEKQEQQLNQQLEALSKQTTKETSFFSSSSTSLFNELSDLFVRICFDKERLAKFTQLPLLKKQSATRDTLLFLSFFLRLSSSPRAAKARAAALSVVSNTLKEGAGHRDVDFQAILPFIIAALSDVSDVVRREAANLLAAFSRTIPKSTHDGPEPASKPWASDTLYESSEQLKSSGWLSARVAHRIVHKGLLPAIEEYILDSNQVSRTIEGVLRGKSESDGDLKKSVRQAFFSFLCAHAIATPVFSVKLRLLAILNRVNKVGSATRTQELSPLLKQWRLVQSEQADRIAADEQLDVKDIDAAVVGTVSNKTADAVDVLMSSVTSQTKSLRPGFIAAVFQRIGQCWGSLKEREVQTSDELLQIALNASLDNDELAGHARETLQTVNLSGPVLVHFLNTIHSTASDMNSPMPAAKRRRTSQNNMVALSLRDPAEVRLLLEKMTFILELVDGSHPEEHPELLGGLFKALGSLHHMKLQMQSEMSYLLSLVLGIMLSIVNKLKETPKAKFDSSLIRADLVVDAVRTSENPQVQNTALLLVAALSSLAPELILHSVMPIFTFMGSSMLRKDDEYSAHVIDQTIDQVVPPLIQSLRSQKKDVVSGTSELLLSFTAAFEHIPSHRRLRLFEALVAKLGPEDFLFAVFSMLANKYPNDRDVLNVMVSLALDFDAGLQLLAYSKYLGLTHDALQPKPSLSYTLLGVGGDDGEEPAKVAVNLSSALTHLIRHALAPKMEDVFEANDEAAENANELFSRILEQTLALSTSTYEMPQVNEAVGSVLGAILGTLTLVDFVDTIEVLLNRKDTDLRVRVLWLLEGRLTGNERDVETQARVIKFLENLVEILKASPEVSLKKAALACITKVVDKYGKNHPDQVVATARVVAAPECLAHTEERLRIMSALCLASSVEVLGQAFIPVLPLALPRCFELLKVGVLESTKQPELHDAVYSFISSLLVHIPWMITEDYLNNILLLSFKSAAAELPESSAENRVDTLRLLARKVDAEETFRAVEANWSAAVDVGFLAVKELLQVTTIAIEKHPKSATVKNLSVLTKILQKGFDIRRAVKASGTMETSEVNECEGLISDIAIKMIYKLNDTIFRPVFIQLTEWAVSGLPKSDEAGRLLRLTTFYKFVGAFFGTLKSIVTSYSSYILESVVDTLKTVKSNDKSVKDLWLATMALLRNSFEHDQDEFWQSPTHLNEIAEPLVNQLATSTSTNSFKTTHATAVPVIVELATAAASPDNHKQINSFILRFMRARGAENPLTRLAAVKCEQALTERLGEEWLVLLPEMLPYISELMEDDDEGVEREVRKWVLQIEEVLGEKLDDMLI